MVVPALETHDERDLVEEAAGEREHEPVVARLEVVPERADPAVVVGLAVRDQVIALEERDANARPGLAERGVEHVRGDGRVRHGGIIVPLVRTLTIEAGPFRFTARLEEEAAPKTCAAVRTLLPFDSRIIHVRWSGEAAWVPMGDRRIGIDHENHTSFPAPGQILVYPGGISEMEILLPYGPTRFASKVGQLAGNHFATVTQGAERLADLGRLVLWEGAQDFRIREG